MSGIDSRLISTPTVELWNLGVEFSKFEMLNSTPKFHNSTAGVEISLSSILDLYTAIEFASNSTVWIKTFQSYYNFQREGKTVAATPKIYHWWPHYFKM